MTMAAADTHYNEGQRQQDQQQQQHDQLAILICSANIGNAEPTRESFDAWIPNDGECCVRSIGSDSGSGGGDDDDDDIGKMARGGNCCIVDDDDHDDDGDNTNKIAKKEAKQKQKFDIIVIGMQEAAFIKTSSSHSNNKLKATDDEDDNTKISKYDGVAVSTDDDDDENDNNDTKEDGIGNVGIINDGNGDEDEGVRDCRSSGDDSGGSNGDGTTTTCGVLLDMVNDGITGVRKGSERSGRRMIQNIGRGNLFMRGLGISSPTRLPRTMLNKA